jgi:hypothetical protein
VQSAQNEYSYSNRNLFIAYGVGFFVALATVVIGLICFWLAAHSFNSSFSTFLRTTRNPELDALIPAAVTSGAYPTPKQIGKRRIVLQKHDRVSSRGPEEFTTFAVVDGRPSVEYNIRWQTDKPDGSNPDRAPVKWAQGTNPRRASYDSLMLHGE